MTPKPLRNNMPGNAKRFASVLKRLLFSENSDSHRPNRGSSPGLADTGVSNRIKALKRVTCASSTNKSRAKVMNSGYKPDDQREV